MSITTILGNLDKWDNTKTLASSKFTAPSAASSLEELAMILENLISIKERYDVSTASERNLLSIIEGALVLAEAGAHETRVDFTARDLAYLNLASLHYRTPETKELMVECIAEVAGGVRHDVILPYLEMKDMRQLAREKADIPPQNGIAVYLDIS